MREIFQEVAFGYSASAAWLNTLSKVIREGALSAPRGQPTLELAHHAVHVELARPLVGCPQRRLSAQFAAAEALWILAGDDRVAPLATYAPQIARFSDDGARLAGAYGPRVVAQLDYVLAKLLEDRDTRQAVLTTWVPNPAPSKDVPCTVGFNFTIRAGRLHCHAFMRSSDVWLGLPYDLFSFSLLAAKVACLYNQRVEKLPDVPLEVELGWLHLTAASSHLYERDALAARAILVAHHNGEALVLTEPIPAGLVLAGDWPALERALVCCRDDVLAEDVLWGVT